jgi:hypothetical protein
MTKPDPRDVRMADNLTPRCHAALQAMHENPALVLRPAGSDQYVLEPMRLAGAMLRADEVRAMLKAGALVFDQDAQGYRAAGTGGPGEALTGWRRGK